MVKVELGFNSGTVDGLHGGRPFLHVGEITTFQHQITK